MRLKIFLALVASAALLSGGSGQANAVIACVNAAGQIRIVAGVNDCASGEAVRQWSVVGPAGPQGPQGVQGPAGPQGVTPLENSVILGTVAISTTSGVSISGSVIGIDSAFTLGDRDVNTLQGTLTIEAIVDKPLDLLRLGQIAEIGTTSPTVFAFVSLTGDGTSRGRVTFKVNPAAVNAPFKISNTGVAGAWTVQEFKVSGVILPRYP